MTAHPTPPPSTLPPLWRLKRRCATKKEIVHCIFQPLLDDDEEAARTIAHPTTPSSLPPLCRLNRRCATKIEAVHRIFLPQLDDGEEAAPVLMLDSEECSFRNGLHMDETTKLQDFGHLRDLGHCILSIKRENCLSLSLVWGDDTFPAQEGEKLQTLPETKNQAIHARFPRRLKQRKLSFDEFLLTNDHAIRNKPPQTPPSSTNR
jgi:hypothetical protein